LFLVWADKSVVHDTTSLWGISSKKWRACQTPKHLAYKDNKLLFKYKSCWRPTLIIGQWTHAPSLRDCELQRERTCKQVSRKRHGEKVLGTVLLHSIVTQQRCCYGATLSLLATTLLTITKPWFQRISMALCWINRRELL